MRRGSQHWPDAFNSELRKGRVEEGDTAAAQWERAARRSTAAVREEHPPADLPSAGDLGAAPARALLLQEEVPGCSGRPAVGD